MVFLFYPGPSDAVEVVGVGVVVRGVGVDMPEEVAKGLLDQGWTRKEAK